MGLKKLGQQQLLLWMKPGFAARYPDWAQQLQYNGTLIKAQLYEKTFIRSQLITIILIFLETTDDPTPIHEVCNFNPEHNKPRELHIYEARYYQLLPDTTFVSVCANAL